MDMHLADNVAVVTGGASGIGRAVAAGLPERFESRRVQKNFLVFFVFRIRGWK